MYHHYQYCLTTKEPCFPPSTDNFILFPLLPPELRLKIWQTIADEPRNIELCCTPTASNIPEGRWFTHTKPPVALQICSESRDVALKRYSLLKFTPDQLRLPTRSELYINFAFETLWLSGDLQPEWARDLLEKNEQLKEKLRFLSVKESLWKKLNDTNFTPILDERSEFGEYNERDVYASLKALEDIKFHS
jgi:hypothetical protein